jgi:formate hydrogenlyase subunit 3/multisubunit Na+/H+ antiporter MnhD subunit
MSVLLMLIPLLVATVVFLTRRLRTITSLITLATLAIEAAVLLRLGPLPAMVVFGRTFELGPAARTAIVWCALASFVIELIAWRMGEAENLGPVALVALPMVGIAFGFRILSFSAISLQIVVLLAVVLMQGEHPGDAVGALRMLTLTMIGLPALLVAGWMLERSAVVVDQPATWSAISIFALIAVLAWSGAAPFQSWVSGSGRTASPVVFAWVVAVWQPLVVLVLARLLATYPELETRGGLLDQLLVVGVLTIVAGTALSVGRRNLGALSATTSLLGMGLALTILGTGTTRSLPIALAVLAGRAVSGVVGGAGLAVLKREPGGLDFSALGGVARRKPWAAAAAFVGALGLAGLPLGAAFGAHWAAYRLLTDRATWLALLGPVASILVGIGWWQGLWWLMRPEAGSRARQSGIVVGLLIALLIGSTMIAVWPNPLLNAGQIVARAMEVASR